MMEVMMNFSQNPYLMIFSKRNNFKLKAFIKNLKFQIKKNSVKLTEKIKPPKFMPLKSINQKSQDISLKRFNTETEESSTEYK